MSWDDYATVECYDIDTQESITITYLKDKHRKEDIEHNAKTTLWILVADGYRSYDDFFPIFTFN